MWTTAKSTGQPLRSDLPESAEMPWTIAYCVRKREQVASHLELPKEKRPPEIMVWWGTPEQLDDWFDRVFERKKGKKKPQDVIVDTISDADIG